jgi:hypothetical protein
MQIEEMVAETLSVQHLTPKQAAEAACRNLVCMACASRTTVYDNVTALLLMPSPRARQQA